VQNPAHRVANPREDGYLNDWSESFVDISESGEEAGDVCDGKGGTKLFDLERDVDSN